MNSGESSWLEGRMSPQSEPMHRFMAAFPGIVHSFAQLSNLELNHKEAILSIFLVFVLESEVHDHK